MLTAYLDGELPAVDTQAIDAALKQQPELQARLESLSIPVDALKSAFDGMLESAPEMPPIEASSGSSLAGPVARITGLAAALVIGVVLGSGVFQQKQTPAGIDGWMEYVAAYQALYVTDTLDVPGFVADKTTLDRLSNRLGVELNVADAASTLEFKRAQVLGFEGRDLIQIAYLAEGGVPVALCLIQSDRTGSSDPQLGELEGMQAASWHADGVEFLLIGGDDPALIKSAAEDFAAVL